MIVYVDYTPPARIVGRDGTTSGFLADFDALYADDPTILDKQRRSRIPCLNLPRYVRIMKEKDHAD